MTGERRPKATKGRIWIIGVNVGADQNRRLRNLSMLPCSDILFGRWDFEVARVIQAVKIIVAGPATRKSGALNITNTTTTENKNNPRMVTCG